jgi:hypothetical protein
MHAADECSTFHGFFRTAAYELRKLYSRGKMREKLCRQLEYLAGTWIQKTQYAQAGGYPINDTLCNLILTKRFLMD